MEVSFFVNEDDVTFSGRVIKIKKDLQPDESLTLLSLPKSEKVRAVAKSGKFFLTGGKGLKKYIMGGNIPCVATINSNK